jgi:branched-chain amino acid transport system ATP-binding protein
MALNHPILDVHDLSISYGSIAALRGCSIRVDHGEVVAVVGANGAGKTTMLRAICNMLPTQNGDITFNGTSTRRMPTYQLARNGMLHIPETRGILTGQTVFENLRLTYDSMPSPRQFDDAVAEIFQIFPRLAERRDQKAGSMSGGEQQMLALSRAILCPPSILLLDEPSLGLAPLMVREAYRILRRLRDAGMSILLVEQNVRAALKFASRAYVLRQGRIVRAGKASELAENDDLFKNYLGVEQH